MRVNGERVHQTQRNQTNFDRRSQNFDEQSQHDQ